MTSLIESVRAEFLRYKALAEAAISQLSEDQLSLQEASGGNSIAVICWHISGNFSSRFTEFLTTDGEKPWRQREEEFQPRSVSRSELLEKWEGGWAALLGALADLTDDHLHNTVTIRQQPLLIHEALHRSLAHAAYHVGQIVYIAKSLRGNEWRYLTIPPGQSDAFNRAPTFQRAADHAARLSDPNRRQ
jgi:uncharacterized damage-inducible protein DinB